MARIRSIKPEFWTSSQILECSRNARLLFIGLWNFCDDAGRHPWSAKQAKAEVFPADDFSEGDVERMLLELSKNDLISCYEHDNKRYFYVTGWRHQRIDKPQPAKYPDPLSEHSTNALRTLPPDRIGEDRRGEDKKESTATSVADVQQFNPQDSAEDKLWKLAPQLSGKGIPKSRLGQLLKLCNHDHEAAYRIVQEVLNARVPGQYLGKVITNLKAEMQPDSVPVIDPSLPEFVQGFKRDGYIIEPMPGKRWRIGGEIYNETGTVVGW